MIVPEIDIFRAANRWAAQYDEVAGDRDGADIWLRIIIAVETLWVPATALH